MHEILRRLPPGARVLDLGSGPGSFPSDLYPLTVVRLDLEPHDWTTPGVVAAAHRLPFRDGSFDAVVANHSLEHTEHLAAVLTEIGRVVRPGGALFVSVPDASTFSDWLYRWLTHGGGHINPIRDPIAFASQVAAATRLPHRATRVLIASFSFMNRTTGLRLPRRWWLFGGGHEPALRWMSRITRSLDRVFHTRTSVYGWAFFFGDVREEIAAEIWRNVCLRCGGGHPSATLTAYRIGRNRYRCPGCGAENYFMED